MAAARVVAAREMAAAEVETAKAKARVKAAAVRHPAAEGSCSAEAATRGPHLPAPGAESRR